MSRDYIIRNGLLLPSAYDDIIDGADLLVRNGRIEKIGRIRGGASEVIDAGGGLVIPGFVQTHVHCCQTLFRGVGENLPLLPWLRNYIWPMEAAHTEDTLRVSTLLTCAELIRSGVTSALTFETVRHTRAVVETIAETGLSAIVSHCLMDDTGGYPPLSVDIDEALGYCDRILDSGLLNERLKLGIAPRFVLSCSEEALRVAADYARDRGLLLHTHASEQIPEVEAVIARTGRRNITYLRDLGLIGPDVCLAHCVHTDEEERRILAESNTHVMHCPIANMKLGSGIAPIPDYLERGVALSIGSDGAACNNRLDMFSEMKTAALIQKLEYGPDSGLRAEDLLHMATLGGAEAMGWDEDTGTLAEGKRADLIVLDIDKPHLQPQVPGAEMIVYACQPEDVALTMAGGQVLYENGQCMTIDEDDMLASAPEMRSMVESE